MHSPIESMGISSDQTCEKRKCFRRTSETSCDDIELHKYCTG